MNLVNARTLATGMAIVRLVWSTTASPVLKQIAGKTGNRCQATPDLSKHLLCLDKLTYDRHRFFRFLLRHQINTTHLPQVFHGQDR